VIDDGNHRCDSQWLVFKTCFPRVAPGGVYVVEDIESSAVFFTNTTACCFSAVIAAAANVNYQASDLVAREVERLQHDAEVQWRKACERASHALESTRAARSRLGADAPPAEIQGIEQALQARVDKLRELEQSGSHTSAGASAVRKLRDELCLARDLAVMVAQVQVRKGHVVFIKSSH
jgi:Spy/CpxP family protein refolding chaperone